MMTDDGDVPIELLTVEQRELVNENLAAAGRYLDRLVAMLREHRGECADRACVAADYSHVVAALADRDSALQVLHVAVERLAASDPPGAM